MGMRDPLLPSSLGVPQGYMSGWQPAAATHSRGRGEGKKPRLCHLCKQAGSQSASRHLQVLTWGADVMRWLYATAQHSPAHQTLVVEAFAAWVRLGLLYEQEFPQMEVQGLLSLTFQALLHSSEGDQLLCLCK